MASFGRMTPGVVEARVTSLNRFLGVTSRQVGGFQLRADVGGYAIFEVINEQGGLHRHTSVLPLRECMRFVDGVIVGIHRKAQS